MPDSKPKYLMLDHGGVLDGTFKPDPMIGADDLVLPRLDKDGNPVVDQQGNYVFGNSFGDLGFCSILKDGVSIVKILNKLCTEQGYQIVFHSKNREEDQLRLLRQLKIACAHRGMIFPHVCAMAVFNKDKYPGVEPSHPVVAISEGGIRVAGYGVEMDGKSCVRQALSVLLNIEENEHENHIVFDDGASIIKAATREKYQNFMIGDPDREDSVELRNALQTVLNRYVSNDMVDVPLGSPDALPAPAAESCLYAIQQGDNILEVYRRIDDLYAYGLKLSRGYSATEKENGEVAKKFAQDIKDRLTNFYSKTYRDRDEALNSFKKFKSDFNVLLHSQDAKLSKHSSQWKPIIANIAIALTGVGAIILLVKLTHSKATTNHYSFFFDQTKRQRLLNQVDKTFKEASMKKAAIERRLG